MEDAKAVIVFTDKGVDVELVGTWTRTKVDTAYKALIRELPRHAYRQLKEETKDGRRRTKN